MTAFVILNEYPAYSSQIRTAILQHHEREDGSGYPRGIRGHETSSLGRILVLAEVVASMVRKLPSSGDLSRIGVALQLGSHKYDPELVLLIRGAFREISDTCKKDSEESSFLSRIEKIGSLIGSWQAAYELLAESGKTSTLANYVNSRVSDFDHSLSSAGCHPDQLSLTYRCSRDDAAGLADMAVLARRVRQFRNIVHQTRRRWGSLEKGDLESQLVLRWLDSCDNVLDGHVA